MPVRVDPEERELDRLLAYAGDLADQAVLEVGCGDGRLTRRYAHLAGRVVGIDPQPERIDQARAAVSLPESQVRFETADVTTYTPREQVDLVFFSWSL